MPPPRERRGQTGDTHANTDTRTRYIGVRAQKTQARLPTRGGGRDRTALSKSGELVTEDDKCKQPR